MSRAGGKDRGLFEVFWVQYTRGDGKDRKEKAGSQKRADEIAKKAASLAEGPKPRITSEWWIRYSDVEGKERREKAGSKSQAQKLYQKRQTEKLQGVKMPETLRARRPEVEEVEEAPKSSTLAEMIEHYREKFAGKASAADDARYARYWIEAFGDKPMDELTATNIEDWREKRLAEPPILGGLKPRKSTTRKRRSPATVNRAVAYLKRVYNLAIRDLASPEFTDLRVREGYRSYNPAAQVDPLTENNERQRYLTESEEERLKKVMEPQDWRILEVSMLTGMRQEEQFRLRRENVDLRTGVLTIPKSKHGEKRHVHLGPRAKVLLKEILAEHSSEWVFPSKTGKTPLSANNYYHRKWLPALKAAKIRDLKLHDLRHTFASRLAMKGVDLHVIRDLLGHSSVTVTERYSHLSPDRLKSVLGDC